MNKHCQHTLVPTESVLSHNLSHVVFYGEVQLDCCLCCVVCVYAFVLVLYRSWELLLLVVVHEKVTV